jgi:hypothetical protein
MLAAIVFSLIMLSMLDYALRVGRIETAMLKARFEIAALRDALIDAAISGAVEIGLVRAIDDLLDISMKHLPNRHFPGLIGNLLTTDMRETVEHINRFEAFLRRPENARLNCIMAGYHKTSRSFLLSRHPVIVPLLIKLGRLIEKNPRSSDTNLKTELKAVIDGDLRKDGQSDLYQYC